MLDSDALQSMNVLIATPCYISAVSMNYVTSLYNFSNHAHRFGLKNTLHMRSESLVPRGRNEIVAFFLQNPQFTHLMWIDSDISFVPGAVCRLLLSDYDVAAGIYPVKDIPWPENGPAAGMTHHDYVVQNARYPFNPIGHWDAPVVDQIQADMFLEVAEAPTGFMCIKRDVFTRMIAHYPDLSYTPEGAEKQAKKEFYWLFFDCMVDRESRRYLSEDYAFCKRWRDMGGKVYADMASNLGHLGQCVYEGPLLESLKFREL